MKCILNFKKNKLTATLISIIVVVSLFILYNFTFGNDDTIESWEQDSMQYKELHKLTKGNSQKIALIDSGISKDQLSDKVKNLNFVKGESNYDLNGHGTMMLSLIKGTKNNPGICPDCSILSIKVMNKEESINPKLVSRAIETAIEEKATVINFSLGSYNKNKLVEKSVKKALSRNISVVASSGDYGTNELMFPANMDDVISVGAIDRDNKIWDQSNASKEVDINAPGVDVTVSGLDKKEFLSSGTSQSTALISGYIALYKSMNPNTSINELKDILQRINKNKQSYVQFLKQKS